METQLSVAGATQAVLWGALALGIVFGAVGQWSRFCVRGAVADWVEQRSPARLSAWLLAIAVGALGTQALISLGGFDATKTVPWSERLVWVSYLVGGTLFGYGMILARGCPQRSLVKAGAGDLKAVVTLLVTGIAAQMTLRGLFAQPRVDGLERTAVALGRPQDLGSLFGASLGLGAGTLRWLIVALFCAAVAVWLWRTRRVATPAQWIGGTVVGLLVPAAFYLTGHIGFVAEHPETLEAAWLGTGSRRPEALTFTAPLANALDLLTFWSDKNTVATFGVLLAAGVLLGSFVSAKLRGDYRVETFKSSGELVNHLIGSVLMGFGGVTAMGCSIGQGVTGLSMLSAGAVLATGGIVLGAWAALRVQSRGRQPAGFGIPTAA